MPYFSGPPSLISWRRGGQPAASGFAPVASSFSVFPLHENGDPFGGNMSMTSMALLGSYNFTNTSGNPTSTWTSTGRVGIYTLNGSTLSLLNSASWTWGVTSANSNISSNFSGLREMTIHSSQWSSAPVFLNNQNYWMALQFVPSATTTAFSLYPAESSGISASTLGWIGGTGGGTSSGTQVRPLDAFHGLFSATVTAVAGSIAQSHIAALTASGLAADPWVRFDAGYFP